MNVKLIFRKPRASYFSIEGLFSNIMAHYDTVLEADRWECPYLSSGFIARIGNLFAVRRLKADVYHITGDVHYLAMALPRKATILTVHDAAVLDRLTGFRRWVYKFFWFDWPMSHVARVTVISEATREYLLEHTNVEDDKLRVIPDCISPRFTYSQEPEVLEKPRLLQIGTKKNKNIERVAEALSGIQCELRIVGKLTDNQIVALEAQGIDYFTVHGLTEEELLNEYSQSHALIFVSTVEGFGMPLLEAQATGRAVVTSNCSSMPEVAGGGACFVNPLDVESIRSGIKKVLSDQEYRAELIQIGLENCKKYSVVAVANKYAGVYHEVATCNSK